MCLVWLRDLRTAEQLILCSRVARSLCCSAHGALVPMLRHCVCRLAAHDGRRYCWCRLRRRFTNTLQWHHKRQRSRYVAMHEQKDFKRRLQTAFGVVVQTNICCLIQKKSQESINARLALVMKSGKFTLGSKTCLKTLRSGKGMHEMSSQLVFNACLLLADTLCVAQPS